jgi:hypothetical protein
VARDIRLLASQALKLAMVVSYVAALVISGLVVACGGGSSQPTTAASPSIARSPTPDATTLKYVALVEAYWRDIVAADGIIGSQNVAARVCLGAPSPNSVPDVQLVDPVICGQRATAILAAQQKFLTSLASTPAPPRYAADDQVFRTQIPKAIADIRLLIRACASGNKQAVQDASNVYVGDMMPAVTNALDDVDPNTPHY